MYWYVAASSAILFFMLDTQPGSKSPKWLVFAVAATIVWGLTILFLQFLTHATWIMQTQEPTVVVRLVV